MLKNCQYESCPLSKVVTPQKDMHVCSCGCGKKMHLNCLISHNRKLTHLLQTNRTIHGWKK